MDKGQLAGSIVIAVGVLMFVIAFILYRKKIAKLEGSLSANGVVTGLTQSNVDVFTSGSMDETLIFREEENIFKGKAYAPVIEFSDSSGRKSAIKGTASSPPKYKLGQQLPVLYLQNNPEKAIIDSFFEKWIVTVMATAFGVTILLSGLLVLLLL